MMPELVDHVLVKLTPDEFELVKGLARSKLRSIEDEDEAYCFAGELRALLISLERRSSPIDLQQIVRVCLIILGVNVLLQALISGLSIIQ